MVVLCVGGHQEIHEEKHLAERSRDITQEEATKERHAHKDEREMKRQKDRQTERERQRQTEGRKERKTDPEREGKTETYIRKEGRKGKRKER